MEGVVCRIGVNICRRIGKGDAWSRNGGDNGQWHCFPLGNFPDDAKKMEDKLLQAAYRPGGNGIVERPHRTVKAIVERGGISPEEATFWYMAPKVRQRDDTVPHRSVFNYEWRHPRDTSQEIDEQGPARIQIGEEVCVKPPNARCTKQ